MTLDVLDRLPITTLFQAAWRRLPSPQQLLIDARHLNSKHHFYYFSWGRHALYWLIKTAGWPQVAVPDFTCPVVVDAITAAGAQPVFLKTNPHTLLLDLDSLPRVAKVPALIAVHTHGLVENLTAIKKLLPHIHIIEDCATALFSQFGSHALVGRRGHSVLVSLYKQVNGLNGALLTTSLDLTRYSQPEPAFSYWQRLFLRLDAPWQWYFDRCRRRQKHQLRRLPFIADQAAADLSRRLFSLNFIAAEKSAAQIQTLIPFYQQHAQSLTHVDTITIDKHTWPNLYRYPLLLKNNRDQVLLRLRSRGIFVDALWDDAYGDSEIARRILTLPIKPHYTPAHLARLFTALETSIKEVS